MKGALRWNSQEVKLSGTLTTKCLSLWLKGPVNTPQESTLTPTITPSAILCPTRWSSSDEIQSDRADQQCTKWPAVRRFHFLHLQRCFEDVCVCMLMKVKKTACKRTSPFLPSPPFPPHGFWGARLYNQAWQQAPLPLYTSHPPYLIFLLLRNEMVCPYPNTRSMGVDAVWRGVFHKEESFGCRSVGRAGEDGLSHPSTSC